MTIHERDQQWQRRLAFLRLPRPEWLEPDWVKEQQLDVVIGAEMWRLARAAYHFRRLYPLPPSQRVLRLQPSDPSKTISGWWYEKHKDEDMHE